MKSSELRLFVHTAFDTVHARCAREEKGRLVMSGDGTYILDAGVERKYAKDSDSFLCPSEEEMSKYGVGAYAKLFFLAPELPAGYRPESMFVLITGFDGETIHGELQNNPGLVRGLEHGDTITFRRENIIFGSVDEIDFDECTDGGC